jgi:riboflavin-specific deaminase-like protein
MHCDLPDDIAWPAVQAARDAIAGTNDAVALVRRDGEWRCVAAGAFPPGASEVVELRAAPAGPPPGERTWSRYRLEPDGPGVFEHPDARPVAASTQAILRAYGPVLLGHAAAGRRERVFVVGHLTQTLDGRIACAGGGPQWFGNDGDRRHTHRMRALADAVMIGAATAIGDDPQLTVREVPGRNPRRLVLSGSGSVLRCGRPLRLFEGHGADVLVAAGCGAATPPGARRIEVAANGRELAPTAVLQALWQQGVRSLYLEGGARTLSSFLQAGCLDLLQVHIAPIVLGSGVSGFQLAPVSAFRDAHHFRVDHVQVGTDLMFVGWPREVS